MSTPRGNLQPMVFVFDERLGHSMWQDCISYARTVEGLIKQMRKGTKDGEYVGWRLIRHEYEELGILTGPVQLKSEPVKP